MDDLGGVQGAKRGNVNEVVRMKEKEEEREGESGQDRCLQSKNRRKHEARYERSAGIPAWEHRGGESAPLSG